jgi:hypothetical protein
MRSLVGWCAFGLRDFFISIEVKDQVLVLNNRIWLTPVHSVVAFSILLGDAFEPPKGDDRQGGRTGVSGRWAAALPALLGLLHAAVA